MSLKQREEVEAHNFFIEIQSKNKFVKVGHDQNSLNLFFYFLVMQDLRVVGVASPSLSTASSLLISCQHFLFLLIV
jgi:hypothetical protein